MAPSKEKWIRRFIITETKRHKNGFTIYKVTSMIFLKASHEEISKISIWKRYNDFKKLHSELSILHKHLGIKESLPTLSKSNYFDRFESKIIEERKKYALKFLEFVGKYSYLYSSDIFITFFETSHVDYSSNCIDSSSPTHSNTSEEDDIVTKNNSLIVNDNTMHGTFQDPCLLKTSCDISTNPCTIASHIDTNKNEFIESRISESHSTNNLQNAIIKKNEQSNKMTKLYVQNTVAKDCNIQNVKNKNLSKNNVTTLNNEPEFDSLNNNINKDFSDYNTQHSIYSMILQETTELSQTQSSIDPIQYLLIAAGHMNAAFKHESIAEYEEAFIQCKLAISCLINGMQFDSNGARVASVKKKISKYLTQAEQLYNKYLNYNFSIVSKPVSELQYYKVLKVMKSVMLVMDIRTNCDRIMKSVEKSSICGNNISDYVLTQRQVPYMVHLYACVETETTIFLILQYASYGKLWDFIRLHYRISDDTLPYLDVISNHVYIDKHVNEEFNSDEINENITKSNGIDKITRNNKLQFHQIDVQSEIYNTGVPTIQLLEKSQKLLQSVNAILKKSNSIASRLNECNELRQSHNVASLTNVRSVIRTSQESSLTLSSSMDDITISGNFLTKSLVRNEILKDTNSLFSVNNSENQDKTENICATALKKNCPYDSLVKNKTSDLQTIDNSVSKTMSMENISAGNIMHTCENNDIKNISNRLSKMSCNELETQCKKNNIEEEQELWKIPETVIRTWMANIILALEALHQQNVLIYNLNPDNIVLDEKRHVRLTYIIPQYNVELSKQKHPYSSPELIKFSPVVAITSATDIWSVGVILYELLTGVSFVTKHPGLFHSHSTLNIPNNISQSGRSLLCDMLKYHAEERLTIDQIKRHPFFAEIDWSNMIESPT